MVRAIPTRMLYTLIIHLWIPPCDSSNGLRNLYYYITGRFFTSRALGNASACPSPPAPLGDLYQIVIKTGLYVLALLLLITNTGRIPVCKDVTGVCFISIIRMSLL